MAKTKRVRQTTSPSRRPSTTTHQAKAKAEVENEPNLWPTLIYWKEVENWRMINLLSKIDTLREIQRDQDKIMQLKDIVDLLQDQELKFVDFENSLDVLQGLYNSLVDQINSLQVLSRQLLMIQEQVDWEESNVSESLSAT
ncbi:1662_t:CDS:2 [Dentiscutata erythropus]|uniref:1662_t:CDS:1 n=1 Tax=Dentiscutata erythropus TaxID=1348616 RepID=A0A9N9NLQ1_9GLOM|nr:1662_t:CDS:2 [Dentiscutata erythropus]